MNTERKHWLLPQEPSPGWEFFAFLPKLELKGSSGPGACRFFWARNAIYHALGALKISRNAHVLLPAYICKTAVEPFVAYGTEVEFYGIDRNCQPDLAEIESKIGPRTEAVLAVHYFGFPQEIRAFREICDRHNLALIEDCAHVLRRKTPEIALGAYGDASVFSWRKFVPVYDGGDLSLGKSHSFPQINWQKESQAFTLKVTNSLANRMIDHSPHPLARTAAITIESAKRIWKCLQVTGPKDALAFLDSNSPSFDHELVNRPMSRMSRWLFRHSDMDGIVSRRKENYLYLENLLRPMKGIRLLHENLPPDVCPLILPLFFDDLPNAHFHLRSLGIPATAWDFVKPQELDLRRFPNAAFLYDNLTFLPIHQSLTRESLNLIGAAVQEVRRLGNMHDRGKAFSVFNGRELSCP